MSKASKGRQTGVLIKAGIPLVAFMLGGSLALSQFMQTHMDIKDKRTQSVSKRKFDLEEEHKMLMQKLGDLSDFTLSRIPRPPNSEDESAAAPVKAKASVKPPNLKP